MSVITYRVKKHDGGWVHEANGAHSVTFPTREAARRSARLAARHHVRSGDTTHKSQEDLKARQGRGTEEAGPPATVED
jgi:hypothetical protein